jgi:two-component system OmpR family sensor kinase
VWALADEERVLQIGRSLAGNALVHTPAGTRVTLGARHDGLRSALEVRDDGPGIPAEHLDRIFDRFYRVEGGMASGSGLGLAIARELAERMDGTLEVRSRPGETVFTLRLPEALVPVRAPELLAG